MYYNCSLDVSRHDRHSVMATFRDIYNYYRQYHRLSLLSIGASIAFELIDLVVPYAIGQILNVLSGRGADPLIQVPVSAIASLTGLPDDQQTALIVLLGLIFLVTVVKAPIQPWLGSWFQWLIPLAVRRDQHRNAIQKILTLPLEFYDENNPGRIANRIAKGIENHTWIYPEIAGQLFPKLVRVFGIFIVILLIQWPIALFFLASFLLVFSFTLIKLKHLINLEKNIDQYGENTNSRNSELITNIKTVKAFATEDRELQRQATRLNREFKVIVERILKGYVCLETYQNSVLQFCLFLVLGFTLAATVGGKISLGYFVTLYTLASMAYAELSPISLLAEVFARRYASMLRFHEFMQLPQSRDSADPMGENFGESYHFTGNIELSHLTFGYIPEKPILQDINLMIEPCQTVALVGRSGSGKSTLVKLLLRYFEPNFGQILIDGEDIQNLDVAGYRRRLAIVHQDVDIFNGTVLTNLTYGNQNATLEEVNEACQIARADEFIDQLSDGYNTIVGERGVRLSGGQKQRLGIARALLVNPDILIFDEATSSLDYESERSIQLAMHNILGTRTTIIIAHRLSTIREADKIVVLDRGKIVEVGSHEELLNRQGIYQRLHRLQETGDVM